MEGGGNWERSVEGSGIGGKKVEEIARRNRPATCNLPSSSIASIDQPSQSAAQHRCRFDAVFSFLKVTIYQHELYRVSHPKQVVNRILRTVLCNQIFGPMSTKTAQISQNCLYNLDGLRWSKDLFSQNIFKIMLANIFGHPAAKTLAR